jgi:7,8-dihydroneopterin aldolase/epimerase/oxygenase
MAQIILENMVFYAYHGFFEEEQRIGNEFCVTVTLEVENTLSGTTDNLTDTLNYQLVYDVVKAEMTITSRLIEHVAQRTLDKLLTTFPIIRSATVSLSKINPPLGGQVERVTVVVSGKTIDGL